jgi:uridine phosphorylase
MNPTIDLYNKTIFINETVPKKGITCSNRQRILNLAENLESTRTIESSWGPFVIIGKYQQKEIFLALAPVGTGCGLIFTELYYRGANAIIRFGSDDIPNPSSEESQLFKIIDEADNLFGYSKAMGIEPEKIGKPIPASLRLVEALKQASKHQNLTYQTRVCHHLEAYHALRIPEAFAKDYRHRIETDYAKVKRQDKPESMDMETAVLFETARLFNKDAASILQTIDKEKASDPYYQQEILDQIYRTEQKFFEIVVNALFRLEDRVNASN